MLEVGGGQGVLSERLAQVAGFVHVVEIDRGLEEGLRDRLSGLGNVALHLQDALDVDLPALDPPPQAMVANLPYGIAATIILRTIEQLPTVESWLVMVQREVGERLAAQPGGRTYGAPSVLAQLSCQVRAVRAVPRTVFRPVPRVDSVLLALRRTRPLPPSEVRALVHAAFAHRRKALAGSLALAEEAPHDIRARARGALEAMGHPADERAERLTPEEFLELAERLRS